MVDHSDTGLGKDTAYADQYDAGLLFPIPRSKARAAEYKRLPTNENMINLSVLDSGAYFYEVSEGGYVIGSGKLIKI